MTMKLSKILLLVLIFMASSLVTLNAQSRQSVQVLLKEMNKEQSKVAKKYKFTKAEITALDRVSRSAGNRLIKIVKDSPGETHQYLINKVNSEFRKLNTEYAKVLSGSKLTDLRNLTNKSKGLIVNNLQLQYIGKTKGIRAGIRTGMRTGIRASLIKGFGGQDLGNY